MVSTDLAHFVVVRPISLKVTAHVAVRIAAASSFAREFLFWRHAPVRWDIIRRQAMKMGEKQ
jgi:hypothetical protein